MIKRTLSMDPEGMLPEFDYYNDYRDTREFLEKEIEYFSGNLKAAKRTLRILDKGNKRYWESPPAATTQQPPKPPVLGFALLALVVILVGLLL